MCTKSCSFLFLQLIKVWVPCSQSLYRPTLLEFDVTSPQERQTLIMLHRGGLALMWRHWSLCMPVVHTVQVGSMEISRHYCLPEELRIWPTLQAYFSKEFTKQAKMGIPGREPFVCLFFPPWNLLHFVSVTVILHRCMVNSDEIMIILYFTD